MYISRSENLFGGWNALLKIYNQWIHCIRHNNLLTINSEAINFYGALKGTIGIQNRPSTDNAFEGEKGILGLIDPPAVLYGTTEIGNTKNLA
jgi:hypothetical protein